MKNLLLLALSTLLFTTKSIACSCAPTTIDESFFDSKAVLLIEVESLTAVRDNDKEYGRIKYLEATFRTIESFKEAEEDIKVLRTYSNCGLELYPSQKYLVFIPNKSSVENYVSHCDGSFHYLPQLEYSQSRLDQVREHAHNKPL